MTTTARQLLTLAVLLGAAGAGARAQAPDLLPPLPRPAVLSAIKPGQVPSLPPSPVVLPLPQPPPPVFEPVLAKPEWVPQEYRLPPQTDPLGCAFQNRDPNLEDPCRTPLGWFADVEAVLVGTHIKNRMVDILQVSPTQFDTVHVPGAGLDWTVMPRFDVGYRLPHSLGEFLVSYQFLNTQGAADLLNSQGVSHQTSRLTWNVFDFDYAVRNQTLVPNLSMRWHVGLRLASMFFDFRGDQPGAALTGAAVEQRASNYMIGAGPHVACEVSRPVNVPGLSLYGRVDLAYVYSHLHQHFEEGFAGPAAFPPGSVVDARTSQQPGFIGVQAGVQWTPPGATLSHFFFGYQFQGWSQVGRNDNIGANADILQHGIFFRGEIDF
jgi:hypothetical protein